MLTLHGQHRVEIYHRRHHHHHRHFLFFVFNKNSKDFILSSSPLSDCLPLSQTDSSSAMPVASIRTEPGETKHPTSNWQLGRQSIVIVRQSCRLLHFSSSSKKPTEELRDEGQKYLSRLYNFTFRSFCVENTCGRCYSYV